MQASTFFSTLVPFLNVERCMDLQQTFCTQEVKSVKAKLTTYKTCKDGRREIEPAFFLSLINNQTNVSKYPLLHFLLWEKNELLFGSLLVKCSVIYTTCIPVIDCIHSIRAVVQENFLPHGNV